MSYSYKVQGLVELQKAFSASPAIVARHGKTAMQKSVIKVQAETVPNVPVGVSSRLRNSIDTLVTQFGSTIEGRVGSSLTNEIYPNVMEFGRRPGARMPPPQALVRWVHLQLGVPSNLALGVAFVVARRIGQRGIKAREFLKKGFFASQSAIQGYFDQALDAIAKDLAK